MNQSGNKEYYQKGRVFPWNSAENSMKFLRKRKSHEQCGDAETHWEPDIPSDSVQMMKGKKSEKKLLCILGQTISLQHSQPSKALDCFTRHFSGSHEDQLTFIL